MALTVSGTLPGVMAEGSRPADWFGLLRVTPDRGTIATVEAVGPGAAHVSLAWDPATGTLAVTPGLAADYEAFLARGLAPELTFSLRATMRNGRVDADSPVFTIPLLDRDDTAPTGLGFASGGSVAAGAIGAVIGTLRVVDPDTPAGNFRFFLPEDEAWRFEVVDGLTLKLRDGITLGLDDIPVRPLVIGVSDGRQEAAFLLDITVTDPNAPVPAPLLMAVGEVRGALALPTADRALVLRGSDSLVDIAAPAGGARAILLRGEADAALPSTTGRIDFLDARLLLPGEGAAAVALALAGTPGGRAKALAAIDGGVALVAQTARGPGLAAFGLGDRQGDAEAGPLAQGIDPAMLALHQGRLGSGESVAQVALDLALMLHAPAATPTWLPWSPGRDTPLADAALAAPVIAPGFALDALLI